MPYYERTYRIGIGGGLTRAVKYLLLINCGIFIFENLIAIHLDSELIRSIFGLHPVEVYAKFRFWQIITYMFLHGGFWHLIFNMLALWMFGCEVERSLGTREFVKYYLICGVGAGFFHILFNIGSTSVVVGASGAIFGVLVAFAVLFPDRLIVLLLFFILPVEIQAKYLVMIFAAVELFFGYSGLFGVNDGIAHFAHLGGMAVGFAYLKLDWRLNYFMNRIRRPRGSKQTQQKQKSQQNMQRFRERVDEILDKINEVGYDKLNAEEKRILQEASQQLGQEKGTEN